VVAGLISSLAAALVLTVGAVLTGNDVVRTGIPGLTRALTAEVPGITAQNDAGNPYQPNIYYRGFLAPPLQGSPQGLAVPERRPLQPAVRRRGELGPCPGCRDRPGQHRGLADGNIQVNPGDHIPGIPANIVKLGGTCKITDKWIIGATAIGESGQYLVGDEANLTKKLPGYVVLNLNTSYQLTPSIEFFGFIDNALDAKYYTYGTFSPTSSVVMAQAPGATNPRSYAIAAPIGGWGGVKVRF